MESGVSRELADYRSGSISDVSYNLEFDVPANRAECISGRQSISFTSAGGDMILDFTGKSVSGLCLNGEPADTEIADGHIRVMNIREGENTLIMDFIPDERSLNRSEDYLYSLFVPCHARSVFPCMDQPDMKAVFSVRMNLPEGWKYVSNDSGKPLSTYLFAFAAGRWETFSASAGGRDVTAYYRETDSSRLAQLPEIMTEIGTSLTWLEDYTGIAMPFEKYDFVIVPGFQFGGMEHPGCIFYNENTMFLPENPTIKDRQKRMKLIAHETAHLWFGDLVTMRWFDDVWTKEVFANYFASRIVDSCFPGSGVSMLSYVSSAMAQDRTDGATPIRQELDNLDDAGLIYNDIIYYKTPLVMSGMVDYMGQDNFREGIREYLAAYSYANADWDDLVGILDSYTEKDLKEFSRVWVHEKGYPVISVSVADGGGLLICEDDSNAAGRFWWQNMKIASDRTSVADTVVELGSGREITIPEFCDEYFIPNADGGTYGYIRLEEDIFWKLLANLPSVCAQNEKLSILNQLYENYLREDYDTCSYAMGLLAAIRRETDQIAASSAISHLAEPLREISEREDIENEMISIYDGHTSAGVRTLMLRMLMSSGNASATNEYLYGIWKNESEKGFSEKDYMALSYEVVLRFPDRAGEIVKCQRARLDGSDSMRPFSPDRLREYDFISPACSPEESVRDSVFRSLASAENRRVEPWAEKSLSLLNHPLRDEESVKYIVPGLELLGEVKATGDIFFPASWCSALLGGHRCEAAYQECSSFMARECRYIPLLKRKIQEAGYMLGRAHDKRK